MTLALPLDGGCLCGTLRYRVKEMPLGVIMCHCDDCKSWAPRWFLAGSRRQLCSEPARRRGPILVTD